MKGILPIWSRRSSQKSSARHQKIRQRRSGTILQLNQLEDRIALATTASYFFPSPYTSGAYLPVGQVDRVRISLTNADNPDWIVDPASFTPNDLSITRNGGSSIDLSNGSPGEFKVGIVGSEVYQNSFWVIGLPRATSAPGDYTISFSGSVTFINPDNQSVGTAETPTGSESWKIRGGGVVAYGSNVAGQSSVPASLTPGNTTAGGYGTSVLSVVSGGDYGLALLANGTVSAWGSGAVATSIPTLTNVVQIAGGQQFAMALRADGTISTWGLNTNNVITNTPTVADGNFFNVAAGFATAAALGDTYSSTYPETVGTKGTLVTWGKNAGTAGSAASGALTVQPDSIQGLIQASVADDYMVGVRSDNSLFGYGLVPDGGPVYDASAPASYVQALAGAKVIGGAQKYVLTVNNDISSSVTGYGSNVYGTINPATVTGTFAPYTSAVADGQSANGTTNIANATWFNLNNVARVEAGDISVIALSSNTNSIKSWGYNGGVTPDGRVTGGMAYSASGSTVGYIGSGATNTVLQVMDLNAPTLASGSIVPQAPLVTGTFPLTFDATFSEPIDPTTFSTGNCQVVYANGTSVGSGFPITGATLVAGTTSTYRITVGTAGTNPPSNFNGAVYLAISSPNPTSGTQIRDIAGNAMAAGTTISSQPVTIATSGFSTSAGTSFDNKQWVATESTITYTLAFSDYVNIAQATNLSNYAFTTISGALTGQLLTNITANENVAGGSRTFTVQVFTGAPSPTTSSASYQVYLKPNTVQFTSSSTFSGQVNSNTVVVDNITPAISGIVPSDINGNAPASTTIVSNSNAAVRFKVSFTDFVSFQGATNALGNYFNFNTSSFAGANSVSAVFSSVTNTAGAAYSTDWIVQVIISGQGTVNLAVNKSYTSGGTTYSIVNPVGTAVSANSTSTSGWTIMSNVFTQSVKVNTYNTSPTTTVVGLNPTNNTPAYFGAPAGVTFNTAQRSRVATTQFNFYAPVANVVGATVTPVSGSDFKLQVWTGDNATGSFVDYNTGKPAGSQINLNVASSWGAGATNYYSTYDLTFRLGSSPSTDMWSLPNGVYQVVMVNPSNLRNIDGVAAANGNAAYQTQFEFYRIFGNGDGNIPGGFPSSVSVTLNDYNRTTSAYVNGSSFWADWSFFSLTDGSNPFLPPAVFQPSYLEVLRNYSRGVYLDGRVIMNL